MQKIFFKLCVSVGILGLFSCSNFNDKTIDNDELFMPKFGMSSNSSLYMDDFELDNHYMGGSDILDIRDPNYGAKVYNKRVPKFNSLIVCRDKQCAPAEIATSKEYIFNSLAHLIDNNADANALLCEANPQAHVCINPYLTIPAKIGVTPAYVYFDGVKIVDTMLVDGKNAIDLVLGYSLSYNGQTPYVCKPDKAMLYVKDNNKVVLNGNGFNCDMTSIGVTKIRVMFSVDYIDMDYGYIGGYYSIGMAGPAYGGGSGYAMIRLPNDAHPLSPILTKQVEKKAEPKVETKESNKDDEKQGDKKEEVKESKVDAGSNKMEQNKDLKNAKENVEEPGVVVVDTNILDSSKQPEVKREPLKLEGVDIRPTQEPLILEPVYEEISVEDLDDYIK